MRTIFLAITLLPSFAFAADLTLTRDGKSGYTIVSPSDPDTSETLAAAELAKYCKQISGANLNIQRGGALPDRAIIVTDATHIAALVPNSKLPDLGGDAFAIISDDSRIYLIGARPRATLYAVYYFLDSLGCRFLAPSFDHYRNSAENIPQSPNLTFPSDSKFVSSPSLILRKLYVEEGHSHDATNLAQLVEWMPKVGFNTLVIPTNYQGHGRVQWDNWRNDLTPELQRRDITIEVGGHGYQNFINASMEDGKLFDQHPEYFGQDAQGRRHKEQGWVLCTSNPAAVDYLVHNLLAYLKDRPEIQIFDFWPPDGAKWCQCDKCTAMGTPSERHAMLVNDVRARVAPVRPDLRLECIAYASYVVPPAKTRLDPSILIDFCPISQVFETQISDPKTPKNAEYASALRDWRSRFTGDISIYTYYRKYAWDSLPMVIPNYMHDDLAFYSKVPVQGVSSYAEPGDWFTYELNHYTLAALAWDTNTDVDALIHKFTQARYGSAAPQAANALLALQGITRHYCTIPGTTLKSEDELSKALDHLSQVREPLQKAVDATTDLSIKRNLSRLTMMLDYASGDIECSKLRAGKAPQEAIRRRATELHAFLTQHTADGVFLIHETRLSLPRMLARYGFPNPRNAGN